MSYIYNLNKSELISLIQDAVKSVITKDNFLATPKNEVHMTIKQTAAYCKVTKQTIHNWFNEGIFKKYKIGGRTLVKAKEVEEFMTRNPHRFGREGDNTLLQPGANNQEPKNRYYLINIKLMNYETLTEEEKVFYRHYSNENGLKSRIDTE